MGIIGIKEIAWFISILKEWCVFDNTPYPNQSRIRHSCHKNSRRLTKSCENILGKIVPIRIKFCTCNFFIQRYFHAIFQPNRSRIKNRWHRNSRRFTKLYEDRPRKTCTIGMKFRTSYFCIQHYMPNFIQIGQ